MSGCWVVAAWTTCSPDITPLTWCPRLPAVTCRRSCFCSSSSASRMRRALATAEPMLLTIRAHSVLATVANSRRERSACVLWCAPVLPLLVQTRRPESALEQTPGTQQKALVPAPSRGRFRCLRGHRARLGRVALQAPRCRCAEQRGSAAGAWPALSGADTTTLRYLGLRLINWRAAATTAVSCGSIKLKGTVYPSAVTQGTPPSA